MSDTSKWLNNLISYNDKNDSGKCPYCNSDKVKVTETNYGRRSLTFVCVNCGKSEHFDGTVN